MRLSDNFVLRHVLGDWLLISKRDSKILKISPDVADVILGKTEKTCDSEKITNELSHMGILE